MFFIEGGRQMKTLETKSSGYAGVTSATFFKKRIRPGSPKETVYPESDGKPMADNTEQYKWIVLIKENLETMFADSPDVFVAADLLWYPVEGDIRISAAPDVMVAFGRTRGRRGSYIQCREEGIPPRVVFEILSPSNTRQEMREKLEFYDRYGAGEYYLCDQDRITFSGWIREGKKLRPVENIREWRSPGLGITFKFKKTGLSIYYPSGRKFTTLPAETRKKEIQRQLAEKAEQLAEKAEQRAERAESERNLEKQRADMLTAKLKSLGITE